MWIRLAKCLLYSLLNLGRPRLAQLLAGRSLTGTICRQKVVIFKQLVNTKPTYMSSQDKFTEPSNYFSVVCSYLMKMHSLISQIVNELKPTPETRCIVLLLTVFTGFLQKWSLLRYYPNSTTAVIRIDYFPGFLCSWFVCLRNYYMEAKTFFCMFRQCQK